MVVRCRVIEGAGAAGTRNPDGRMRLLDRPGPDVHHRQLKIFSIPREDFLRRPSLEDQIVRFAEALALLESSMAYSSAIRIGGWVPGRLAPICTMAQSNPCVARANMPPMTFGFGMNP